MLGSHRYKEISFSIVVVFIVILLLLLKFPFEFIVLKLQDNHLYAGMWAGILCRLLIVILGFFLIKKLGLLRVNGLGKKWEFKNVQALLIPIGIIAISIFNKSDIYANAGVQTTLLFLVFALTVGFTEEIIFRGVIFPILVKANFKRKYTIVTGALMASLYFGIVHYLNIFKNLDDPANFSLVTSQVIFAFCIGVAFSGIFVRVQNIIPVAILHGLFNFAFGTQEISQDTLGTATTSNSIDLPSLIFTVVVWLLIMGSGIFMILISDKDHFLEKIRPIKSINIKRLFI